jgi:putative phosphoribosyl transferase
MTYAVGFPHINEPYPDRAAGGQALGRSLRSYAGRTDLLVLALPRGGVPVGYEVAVALDSPLDVFLVRKLGVPGHEELAMGAIASGGVRVVNDDVLRFMKLDQTAIERAVKREEAEIARREHEYRGDAPPTPIAGRTVFLIDDGLATGATMRAAAVAIQSQEPARLVIAVPVATRHVCRELRRLVDQVVCLMTPDPFYAVGVWYDDFTQTSDTEVKELLERRRCA